MRRQSWGALVRRPEVDRLIQLAAAAGVAVFGEAGAQRTVAAMRWLLESAILAEQGLAPAEMPDRGKEEQR
ncbi:MAG TPA: hypothetical protein VGM51_04135 [Armatimonadota bacterium]|jgi:hypothetical protein